MKQPKMATDKREIQSAMKLPAILFNIYMCNFTLIYCECLYLHPEFSSVQKSRPTLDTALTPRYKFHREVQLSKCLLNKKNNLKVLLTE